MFYGNLYTFLTIRNKIYITMNAHLYGKYRIIIIKKGCLLFSTFKFPSFLPYSPCLPACLLSFLPSFLLPLFFPVFSLSLRPFHFFSLSFFVLVSTYQINFIAHQWVIAHNFEKYCPLRYKRGIRWSVLVLAVLLGTKTR